MSDRHTLIAATMMRLDQLLASQWKALDREAIKDLVTEGAVTINGRLARKVGQRIHADDEVSVLLPDLEVACPASLPLGLSMPVVYEDEALLIVDKPSGIPVRSSRKPGVATVPQLLASLFPEQANVGGVNRAGVVTSLGEDASGLVLAGREETTYRELRRSVKRQRVTEAYTALVEGRLRGEFTIDQPIGNVKRTRQRLAVAREGRPALTFVREQQHLVESGKDYTLVYIRPQTSRLHQIRVHLSWYGFPIVGDRVYGSSRQVVLSDRIFLHLSEIRLLHPHTGDELRISSQLPPELRSVLTYLRRQK